MSGNGTGARGGRPPAQRAHPVRGLTTGQQHPVKVDRVAIPVVFVPGIMGSRLAVAATGEKVWDPDDNGFMLSHYLPMAGFAARRKTFLLGSIPDQENRFRVLNDDQAHNDAKQLTKSQREAGWGGVAWRSYSEILKQLDSPGFSGRIPELYKGKLAIVLAPVYAFGYDWTASCDVSGKALKDRIDEIVRGTKAKGWECPGVIVVTHSMGGIVTRSACKQGAEGQVIGVVHGVQPVTGSPAAYWRMKAGFPSGPMYNVTGYIGSGVLGNDGRDVTAILGNIRGGLELLPTRTYTVDGKEPRWLRWPGEDGKTTLLPANGDPYASIYTSDSHPWRLIDDPAFLTPEAQPAQGRFRRPDAFGSPAWRAFKARMAAVQEFHNALALYQHPRTYHFHATGVVTPDHVALDREEVITLPPARFPREYGEWPTAAQLCQALTDTEPNVSAYVRWEPIPRDGRTDYGVGYVMMPLLRHHIARLTLQPAAGDGDGTVPTSSGSALEQRPGAIDRRAYDGIQHEPAYADGRTQKYTMNAVLALIQHAVRV